VAFQVVQLHAFSRKPLVAGDEHAPAAAPPSRRPALSSDDHCLKAEVSVVRDDQHAGGGGSEHEENCGHHVWYRGPHALGFREVREVEAGMEVSPCFRRRTLSVRWS